MKSETRTKNQPNSFGWTFTLPTGQTEASVTIKLRVRDDEYNWDSRTITYTIRQQPGRTYYLKDHLGNVRVTVNEDGGPIGWDDYYPFGKIMPGRSSNNANPNDLYKYNSKELDTEADLNLAYYGARMYDPEIGRFMSIDRFADKYPSMTPYQYAANNPVMFIDVNGDSVWVSIGENSITLHYQGKILNASDKNIDLDKARDEIISSFQDAFTGTVAFNGEKMKLNIDANISVANSEDDVAESDHLIVIQDLSSFDEQSGGDVRGFTPSLGHKITFTDAGHFFHYRNPLGSIFPNSTRSTVHEMGHQLGLGPVDRKDSRYNLMVSGGSGTEVSDFQRGIVLFHFKNENLNQGSAK